jgi:hypothetical protein
MEGGVGLAVAATVEPPALGLAGGCLDRADPAEDGEGGFGVETVGVVTGGDEQVLSALLREADGAIAG